MKNKNILISLLLLGIAAVVALSSLGYLGSITSGKLIIIGVMAVISIGSLFKLFFCGFLFPIAVLYLCYGKDFGLVRLGTWETIVITVCVSLALEILFDPLRKKIFKKHDYSNHQNESDRNFYGTGNEEFFYEKANLCNKIRHVNAASLNGGKLECLMATMQVYFDRVEVPSGKCFLDIDCRLGTIELFIPGNWAVESHVERTLSNIEDKPYNLSLGKPAVTLVLDGEISLASIHINRM